MKVLSGTVCDGEDCTTFSSPCILYGPQRGDVAHGCLEDRTQTIDENKGRRIVYTRQVDGVRIAVIVLLLLLVVLVVAEVAWHLLRHRAGGAAVRAFRASDLQTPPL